jgi:hypothetical protein
VQRQERIRVILGEISAETPPCAEERVDMLVGELGAAQFGGGIADDLTVDLNLEIAGDRSELHGLR